MPPTRHRTPDAADARRTARRATPLALARVQVSVVSHAAPALPRTALVLCVVLALCVAARAQQQTAPPAQRAPETAAPANAAAAAPAGEAIDEDDVLRIDSNLVHIPALVMGTTGRPVQNLRLEDFELRVDGQPKPLAELGRADTPVALAVLFDNSSSLSKAREFEKQAATRFLTRIVRPIDRASIYSISTVPLLVRPLTNSVPVLVRTVEQFPDPEGATALFDTLAEAAAYLRPQQGRRVIVIVSDGNDTISEQTFDQALQRALKADCQIYVVGTGDIESRTLGDDIARRRLQVLAAQTGGAVYVPRSVQDLDYAFEQISRDISQQYVLSYHPVDDPSDGRFRVIDLRVKNQPGLRVRAREGYYASIGQARVRPRTVSGPKRPEPAAANAARKGPRPESQAPSLDPLYAPAPNISAPARGAASNSSEVTFKARPAAARATNTRRGPAESADSSEPERAADAERTFEPAGTLEAARADETARASAPTSQPVPSVVPAAMPAAPRSRQMSFEVARGDEAAPPQPAPSAARQARDDASEQTPAAAHPSSDTQPAAYEAAAPAPQQNTAHATASPTRAGGSDDQAPVSGGVLNGRALRLPPPIYPQAARSARAGGNVTIEVEIDEGGRVVSAQAVSGHRMLHGAALQAARLARFSPTFLSGRPVRIKGTIVYNFITQ